jgi:hypothetical protein
MHVPDRLTRAFVAVDHDAIALRGYASLGRDFVRDDEYVTHQARVAIIGHIGNPCNVLLWNDQNVYRRLSIEIIKCRDVLILIDKLSDLACRDLAENAILQPPAHPLLFPIPYRAVLIDSDNSHSNDLTSQGRIAGKSRLDVIIGKAGEMVRLGGLPLDQNIS